MLLLIINKQVNTVDIFFHYVCLYKIHGVQIPY